MSRPKLENLGEVTRTIEGDETKLVFKPRQSVEISSGPFNWLRKRLRSMIYDNCGNITVYLSDEDDENDTVSCMIWAYSRLIDNP